jgi:hypothetical protein
MKTILRLKIRVFICLISMHFMSPSFSQGRVVINEYMPWTASSCGSPTAEFVELLNFGPGPMNIGCYILTDGDYSITIPANTIIQPGEFYVISGRDVIDYPCANIDSTIHTQLNWTTCNCTSGTIPTTGDGFLTDGGSGNEQLVLLDPNLNVIDAVARSLPVETASLITTSGMGGLCTPKSFDLDLMVINYETIGESAGRGNSFARRLDGDCGWVKDPQQSAHATNNTPGDVSDVQYSFAVTKAQACPNDGSVQVTVLASSYTNIFPMSYTLAYDTDGDGIFELTDSYTYGTTLTPNKIIISNLVPGSYRLTVASVKGCFLHTFPFVILDCFPVVTLKLLSFAVRQTSLGIESNWSIANSEDLRSVIIESGTDRLNFESITTVDVPANAGSLWNWRIDLPTVYSPATYYRLKMIPKVGAPVYSSIVSLHTPTNGETRIWPNPVMEVLFAEGNFNFAGIVEYSVYRLGGQLINQGEFSIHAGNNSIRIPMAKTSSGVHYLLLKNKKTGAIISRLPFVKQLF